MAKHGNKSSGSDGEAKGPCTDCGKKEGPFTAIRRHTSTGKGRMIQLCPSCNPPIDWKKT